MRWLALIVAVALIGFAATTLADPVLHRFDDSLAAPPSGSAAVYAGIEASTDCGWLQASFDRAADNNERAALGSSAQKWTANYMSAANDRMRALGC